MKYALTLMLLSFHFIMTNAQPRTDAWLERLVREKASPFLLQVLDQPDTFRYQVIYTRIDRNRKNIPSFQNFYLHVDPELYFNPASMVKMPVAFLALEKLNRLGIPGVDKFTSMLTDTAGFNQTPVTADSSAENGMPSIAQYIRKVFLVSDNEAYNRLYEFVGQETINRRLWEMGYRDARITRRFVRMTEEENRHTNPIRFLRNGELLYQQPAGYNALPFDFGRQVFIGRAHYDRDEQLVASPMDFTRHNSMPLEDMQQVLQAALFPTSVKQQKRFGLTGDDYRFLYQYMSQLPSESRHPAYDTAEFFDSYTKFFFFKAGKQKLPPYLRSFNKTGWSYGFLTDVCYIVDFKHGIEFMLSANIYVNKDGVLNDDKYEYEETGYPFFRELGQIIYEYELGRKRKYTPILDGFKMDYGEGQDLGAPGPIRH